MLASGDSIDRYVVDAAIGAGGLARVYRVHHQELGSVHAIKVLQYSGDRFRERLREEGRIQVRLRHPNIVAVTDMVTYGELPCLVMEYVRGPALDLYLDEVGPLPFDQLDIIAHDMLSGLAHAHRQSMIHRDLKPSNVMLALEDGTVRAKLTDYGLGKMLNSDQLKTRTNVSLGTPAYMAPEQIRDAKSVDARADVYAAGVMLHELLTGQRCFPQTDLIERYQASRDGTFCSSTELRPQAPARMHTAIARALEYDQAKRPSDAAELLALWFGETRPPERAEVFDEQSLAVIESLRLEQQEATGHPPPARAVSPSRRSPPPTQPAPTPITEGHRSRYPLYAGAGILGVLVVLLMWVTVRRQTAGDGAPSATVTEAPTEELRQAEPVPAEQRLSEVAGAEALPSPPDSREDAEVQPMDQTPPEPAAPPTTAPSSEPSSQSAAAVSRPPASPTLAPAPPPVPQTGTVLVTGVENAQLVNTSGEDLPPGEVPVGRWSLVVYFTPSEPTTVMQIEVTAGETRQVRCDSGLKLCR